MRREDDFPRHGSELYEIAGEGSCHVIPVKSSDYALVDTPIRLIETVHFDPSLRFITDGGDGFRLISCRAKDSLTSIRQREVKLILAQKSTA